MSSRGLLWLTWSDAGARREVSCLHWTHLFARIGANIAGHEPGAGLVINADLLVTVRVLDADGAGVHASRRKAARYGRRAVMRCVRPAM